MYMGWGLIINYEKKTGAIHQLTINFDIPEIFIEDFGQFTLPDAINIIVEKLFDNSG